MGSDLKRLLDRGSVPYSAPDEGELDITDPGSLRNALENGVHGGPFTVAIHAAALTQVDACEEERAKTFAVNATATGQFAGLCAERNIPFVYISTDFVFDGSENASYEVEDTPSPINVYGASKLAGEEAVRKMNPRHYILRTAWLFGVNGDNFPVAILKKAASGEQISVVDDQNGCPTYSHDLAEIVLAVIGMEAPFEGILRNGHPPVPAPFGTYHATNGDHCSRFEFAREIIRQSGWKTVVRPIGSAELRRPARRPSYSVLSPASISGLGLHVRPWPLALADFLDELRQKKPELFHNGGRSR